MCTCGIKNTITGCECEPRNKKMVKDHLEKYSGLKLFTNRGSFPYKLSRELEEVEIIYQDVTLPDGGDNNIKGTFHKSLKPF